MGVRSVIIVKSHGKTVVAQYGQWDGNPEDNGENILSFFRKHKEPMLRAKLSNCRFLTDKEYRELMSENGVKQLRDDIYDYLSLEQFYSCYPSLSEHIESGILDYIAESSGPVPLLNAETFGDDAMFCEFSYIIDLDERKIHAKAGGLKARDFFCCGLDKIPGKGSVKNAYLQFIH